MQNFPGKMIVRNGEALTLVSRLGKDGSGRVVWTAEDGSGQIANVIL